MTEMNERETSGIDVLAELGTGLAAVAPSPEFHARVRARVADESIGERPRWWLACAMAGVLTAVVVAVALREAAPDRVPSTANVTAANAAIRAAATAQQTVLPAGPRTARQPAPGRDASRVPARRNQPAPAVVTDVAGGTRFDVVTNQGAVLAELWRAAQSGTPTPLIDGDLPTLAVAVGVDGSILVPDIVVEPIAIPPIGGSPGAQGRIQRVTSPEATGSPR